MKKLASFFALAIIALMSFSLSSCDEDHEIALTLDGTWRGTVDSNNGSFFVDLRFYQSGFSAHGTGYEYDEPINGYSRGTYAEFDWSVNNGCIYLRYDDGSNVVISDYTLRSGQLVGYLQNARNGWDMGYIRLTKLSDNRYDDGYNYYVKQKQKVVDDSNEVEK